MAISHSDSPRPVVRVLRTLLAFLFVSASIGAGVFFLTTLAPIPFERETQIVVGMDPDPILSALTPDRIGRHQRAIAGAGSRLPGTEGYRQTVDYLRSAYESHGLEVHEVRFPAVSPLSRIREFASLTPDGQWAPADFEIYPLLPNAVQPVVTPDEGMQGELILLTPEVIRSRSSFDDVIGLIDVRPGMHDERLGFAWERYARLGLNAIVVSHPDGVEHIPWDRVYPPDQRNGMTASALFNYVRLAADPGIFEHVGERVRLRVDARMETVEATNLVGVLRAPRSASEAIIIPAKIDAFAVLPDRAPGVLMALNPAVHLGILEGLSAYRDSLTRDVIFFASGSNFVNFRGQNELIKILGLNRPTDRNPVTRWIRSLFQSDDEGMLSPGTSSFLVQVGVTERRHQDRLRRAKAALELIGRPGFMEDMRVTQDALGGLSREARSFFDDQYKYVLNTMVFEKQEDLLQARIKVERIAQVSQDTPELVDFLRTRARFDRISANAGRRLTSLMAADPDGIREFAIQRRLQERFEELVSYHQDSLETIGGEKRLARLLGRYDDVAAFEFTLMPEERDESRMAQPAQERLGISTAELGTEPWVKNIHQVLTTASERAAPDGNLEIPSLRRLQSDYVEQYTNPLPRYDGLMWKMFGYGHYHVMSLGRRSSYRHFASPGDLPWMWDLSSLEQSLAAVGYMAMQLAHGEGGVGNTKHMTFRTPATLRYNGRVLASGIGLSIVPDYPMAGALVFPRTLRDISGWTAHGRYDRAISITNPYGEWEELRPQMDYVDWDAWFGKRSGRHSPMAVWFGDDGLIQYIKDEGPDGQKLFKSVNLPRNQRSNITIVTFRGSPVTLLDLTNPKTLTEFTSVEHLTASGLAAFPKRCEFEDLGVHTTYLPPDERFVTLLKAGVPGNEMVQRTQAFLLNPPEVRTRRELEHPGFLVADTPVINLTAREAARSLVAVNSERLHLQNRYHMADERTNLYHERALELMAETTRRDEALPLREVAAIENQSATFGMLNHPVLRGSVFEAVVGILWYLGLLVPFVFFTEKLLFSFNDVRKQLATQAVIFLAVFFLLRTLHPAFEMIRSSLMILLGFVIILIAGGITLLFSGKFSENFAELRRRQGRYSGTEANTMGVTATAFVLGLNNMNRRKLRTGLTCGTLTLLTFVMISFTSVSNPLRDSAVSLGRAPYQGVLVKRENFTPIQTSELFALQQMYGEDYVVAERTLWVGGYRGGVIALKENPRVEAIYTGPRDDRFNYTFETVLQLHALEPLREELQFITETRWFTPNDAGSRFLPVMIPDAAATILGVDPEVVDSGNAFITLNGVTFRVHSIFRADSLEKLNDLDGSNLLPYDITHLDDMAASTGQAPPDALRIPARLAVITPTGDIGIEPVAPTRMQLISVAIDLRDAPFREASQLIEDYLVRMGEPTYYGIGDVAYQGEIRRAMTMTGLVDLLIPLIIAAMTVLNTMRGSVYERTNDIYIYNAVGIAPRYVFFMFFAEAIVYAVIGSMLGYLLSQGTGRILTELGLTGGLQMTYAGMATIYASLAVAASVILSTYFPARDAMRISAPADDSGWDLPEPEGDDLRFDLPFTFDPRERLAVLKFVERYLLEHGEGSAGKFFSSVPQLDIQPDPLSEDPDDPELVPLITCTIWLKPFDLGVSQTLTIHLPYYPETGKFKARVTIHRLSGTRAPWIRHNKTFVSRVRRHFLHWRAISHEDRQELFQLAQQELAQSHEVSQEAV